MDLLTQVILPSLWPLALPALYAGACLLSWLAEDPDAVPRPPYKADARYMAYLRHLRAKQGHEAMPWESTCVAQRCINR